MDKAKLAELLQASQIPDTEKVKAVTAELQQNYYSKPESLLLLIEIAISHNDAGIRQLASVQASRVTVKHWPEIPNAQKDAARKHLLESAVNDSTANGRHSKCRLVARTTSIDLADEEQAQGARECITSLLSLVSQDNVAAREVGSFTLFAVLEDDPTPFVDQVPQLLNVLKTTIADPVSVDVRLNSAKALGSLLMLVDPEEDAQTLTTIHSFVQPIVEILKATIDAEDEEQYKPIFEVFQNFLAYDSAFLAPHLQDLVQFFIDLASNTEVDDEARSQALTFLSECAMYRRMKIQGMKDMGAQLMTKSMKILTELDEDDDADETTPARTALALIDQLASALPPRQVIVPLLDNFTQFASSNDAGHRKAAILALGHAAEGAPDFIATQLSNILPAIIALLNDHDDGVRYAALIGLIHLAEEMADELASKHEDLIAALLRNLEAATQDSSKKNIGVIRSVCSALDSLVGEALDNEAMKSYGPKLIVPMGNLLNHDDLKVKSSAAGAVGAIATAMGGEAFKAYFSDVMSALTPYVSIRGDEETLDLRSAVCDAMGRIAGAVGPEAFKPYVMTLMKASEEGLKLDSARLKETSFILWSSLSKVYGTEFKEFLPGVFAGLLECLDTEEEELEIPGLKAEDAPGGIMNIGGRKIKVKPTDDEIDQAIAMDDDDDDEDWMDDLAGVSAVDTEQEIALDVIGDVLAHTCDLESIQVYLEPAMEKVMPLCESAYDGSRRAALATLWRAYARVWQLFEEANGSKWQPGLPLKQQPPTPIISLGELVTKATLLLWADDSERDVITEINRSVAATLKTCGPAILEQKELMQHTLTVLGSLITRSHPCQQDMGDEEGVNDGAHGTSEYDWLVIDTALDVVLGLATALGPDFAELWKVFEKPALQFASSQESLERSTAVGVIADAIKYMGNSVTQFTNTLFPILFHRLSDEDPQTKSNAAYAIGQLIANSADTNTTFSRYSDILNKLEPMLSLNEAHISDNVAGCLCRMITANPQPELVQRLLPAVLNVLPLKEDYEENEPIYQCIYKLYDQQNPGVQGLNARLGPILQQVLSPPEEQLEPETRAMVQKLAQAL